MSAEYACGQILFSLKNSNLHYLIKETHLSAYITIRKKLIRDPESGPIDKNVPPVQNDQEIELNRLRERTKDLETRLELAKVEFEEMEITKGNSNDKISNQDEEIEGFLKSEKLLKDKIDRLTKENQELKISIDDNLNDIEELEERNGKIESDRNDCNDKIEALYKEIFDLRQNGSNEDIEGKTAINKVKILEKKLTKANDDLNEASDNIIMLENTLVNKRSEIERLREKLEQISECCEVCGDASKSRTKLDLHSPDHIDESVPSTSKCGMCDFESDDDSDMLSHKTSDHTNLANFNCINCKNEFQSKRKLQDHMCRIVVLNPTCGDSYTKNWIIFDTCTRIYSESLKEEVVFLHTQKCIDDIKRCPDMLPYYDNDMVNCDRKIWHAHITAFFAGGEINWKALRSHFGINVDIQ